MGSYSVVSTSATDVRILFYQRVHGDGVAASGWYPTMDIYVYLDFHRDIGSSTVTWSVHDIGWDDHDWSGRYDFRFCSNISVAGAAPAGVNTIMSMAQEDYHYNWWDDMWFGTPSGSFTSTTDTTTVTFYVECRNCTTSGHFCFDNGEGDYPVDTYTVPIPTYAVNYNVTYDPDGGSPAPNPLVQTKSSIAPLQITSTIPAKAVTVRYYRLGGALYQYVMPNLAFTGWKCSVDQRIYTYPNNYELNQACIMKAQWGNASFVPPALPDETFMLTYNYNGTSGTPTTALLQRTKVGYNTNSGASQSTYDPGTSCTTTGDLNLYMIYGSATVVYNNLPQNPTRSGYVFKGWYKDSACTQKITANYTITANTTIYAGWGPLPIHRKLPTNVWNNEGPCARVFKNGAWSDPTSLSASKHIYKFESGRWVDKSQ